jgi:putative transposase
MGIDQIYSLLTCYQCLTSETYKATGKGLSRNDIINLLPSLKKEYEWLTEPPSQCLQQVALDL